MQTINLADAILSMKDSQSKDRLYSYVMKTPEASNVLLSGDQEISRALSNLLTRRNIGQKTVADLAGHLSANYGANLSHFQVVHIHRPDENAKVWLSGRSAQTTCSCGKVIVAGYWREK